MTVIFADPLVSPVITSVTINNSNRLNVNLDAYKFPENITGNITLAKFIVSYERFDLKVPVMVRYQRYATNGTAETEGPLSVAGAKYRIKAWVIYDKQFSPVPSELEYYVPERGIQCKYMLNMYHAMPYMYPIYS